MEDAASIFKCVITGPTATGKTGLSLRLAEALLAQNKVTTMPEVVSADSRLVYRGLNIGTAKPTPEEQARAKHHLVDVVEPTQMFTVNDYEKEAEAVLKQLAASQTLPLIVGGTGFYLRALLETSDGFIPTVPPNWALREKLNQYADTYGDDALHQKLQQKDPERAAQIHHNNRVRVIRALEIVETTGEAVPFHQQERDERLHSAKNQNVLWLGLTYADRDKHRKVIDDRIDKMLTAGWLEEVEVLMAEYGPDCHALKITHGYPEWMAYLQGARAYDDVLEDIRIQIHQYARRQRTWFRRNPNIHWFYVDEQKEEAILEACLQKVEAVKDG